jgi:hypothetical protein
VKGLIEVSSSDLSLGPHQVSSKYGNGGILNCFLTLSASFRMMTTIIAVTTTQPQLMFEVLYSKNMTNMNDCDYVCI